MRFISMSKYFRFISYCSIVLFVAGLVYYIIFMFPLINKDPSMITSFVLLLILIVLFGPALSFAFYYLAVVIERLDAMKYWEENEPNEGLRVKLLVTNEGQTPKPIYKNQIGVIKSFTDKNKIDVTFKEGDITTRASNLIPLIDK